jgi:sulfide:quinone oxidoreductase
MELNTINTARPKIVVLGGGFGGLETAFYLRMRLRDRVDITLVSDRDRFLFKPNSIYIPFGLDPERLMIPLFKPLAKQDIRFVQARAREIDPARKTVLVDPQDGMPVQKLPYDYLVVATGAGMRATEVPGLAEHAQSIWTVQAMLDLRAAFDRILQDGKAGRHQQVLFLVPPNNKCSGPLYELVQMLDTWLRRKKVRREVDITWSTYESGYIQAFGPRLDEVVGAEFDRRGITGHRRFVVDQVAAGSVHYKNGHALPYDLLISFPPYIGSTPFPGLPSDDRGFISTELETRQVTGYPEIYAVGDAADFPVKQAFLAFLQADAAAEQIAAQVTGRACGTVFEPTSMCVMEQFDTATFAQVPLRLTGDSVRPVEVDPQKASGYRVGSSPWWRLGKMLLGVYLPWRFGSGHPFHAGLPWQGMELGLKAMDRLLAQPAAGSLAVPPVQVEHAPPFEGQEAEPAPAKAA